MLLTTHKMKLLLSQVSYDFKQNPALYFLMLIVWYEPQHNLTKKRTPWQNSNRTGPGTSRKYE